MATGFVVGHEITCFGLLGIVLELGTVEDGLSEWVHVGLFLKGNTYEYYWMPHEMVSHAFPFDPTVNMFSYFLLQVSK